jgi:hypothetical protein
VPGTRKSYRSSRTRWILIAVSVIVVVIVTTVALGSSNPRGSVRRVAVPSLISLPAPEVQDALKNVHLVDQPHLLGWKSTAPPSGSIVSQSPRAGTLVAVGTSVQVGFYLAGPGDLESAKWSTSVTGRQTQQGSYANPAQSGSLITAADLRTGPLLSKSFVGPDGYALASVDGFIYPVVTTDAGTTWRIAGLWFAGPWADGAAFPSTIRAYSVDVAVAFYPGEDIFYATTDGGAEWFVSGLPGNVEDVSGRLEGSATSSITVKVANQDGAKRTATYRTVNSGRLWSLIRHAGVSGNATVPNLSGMKIAQASSTLLAHGFVPLIDHLWAGGDSPQVVVNQTPSPGASAPRGADVAIAVPH